MQMYKVMMLPMAEEDIMIRIICSGYPDSTGKYPEESEK